MTAPSLATIAKFARGIGLRQLRLSCGIILFAYLISHFLNHALGIISTDALAAGVVYHLMFWQYPPVAMVFYTAAAIHLLLGVWSLYARRQMRWRTFEPLQLVLGLSIPILIASHVIGIRLSQALFQTEKLYPQVIYNYWVAGPEKIWLMLLVICVSWIHGCMGLYFWLRLKPFFADAKPYLLVAAVMLPTLAMLGFYQSGRAIVQVSSSPQWQTENNQPPHITQPPEQQVLDRVLLGFLAGYLGLVGVAIAARLGRSLLERRGGLIVLSYDDGRRIRVPRGLSVLDASILNNVPHASVCGGRARCSTCRIRITSDASALPPPSKREAFVLDRVGAAADPAIRLACQLRPTSDLTFIRLFMPQVSTGELRTTNPRRVGQERYLISMFIDMRGSTELAEKLLPFDTVYIVNQFLNAVSQAVTAAGGQPNQFYGDGQLALFGLQTDPQTACRQALRAAARLAANVDDLNRILVHDGRQPIRFGIGIHGGVVIIGDIGDREHMVFTALGDAVNVAARLQDMTKTLECETILSEEVRLQAALPDNALPTQEVAIRGRAEPMRIHVVAQSAVLSGLVDDSMATAS